MKKFYFDNTSREKNYGVYESLMENQKRIEYNNNLENFYNEKYSKLKSLGAVNKDKYVLFVGDIDKVDHIAMVDWAEKILGNYNFWFSFWYSGNNLQKINIYHTTEGDKKTIFEQLNELENLMGIISECTLYNNINYNGNWSLEMTLPSFLLDDKNSVDSFLNLGQCLAIVQNKYNELKKNYIDKNPAKIKTLTLNRQ